MPGCWNPTVLALLSLLSVSFQSFHMFAAAHGFILTNAAGHSEASGDTRTSALNTAIEERENAEEEEGIFADDYYPGDGGSDWGPSTEQIDQKATSVKPAAIASVFEHGETRDFLHFLRRIKYDHRHCPENGGDPVEIDVSIVVSNIRAVSEVTMDYSLELFYRESWLDARLDYDKELFANKTELALHESYANFLWHPDTFMPNAIASKNPQKQSISHRSLLRLQEKGRILYSRRISIVAECPMDLTLFPFDSQTCKLGIESYGYTADQVRYKWSTGQINALSLLKIRLPDFQIREAFVTSQMEIYATGNYSRLYVCFVFARSSGFCFLQLIIPSTAVVITSWVALWMESETEFQDMISIILAITFLIFSYNEMMPRVSYLKALDIWLAVCFMIVFLSLIKLAMVKYMRQRLNMGRNNSPMLAEIVPVMCVTPTVAEAEEAIGSSTPPRMCNGNLQSGLNLPRNYTAVSLNLNCGNDNGANSVYISAPGYGSPLFRSNSVQLKQVLVGNGALSHEPACFTRRMSRLSQGRGGEIRTNVADSSDLLNNLDGLMMTNETTPLKQFHKQNEIEFITAYPRKNGKKPLKAAALFLTRCRFTSRSMKRFHWISQMIFFFGFIIFALFYFLVYPNLHLTSVDPACIKENAEWFAQIS